MPPRFLERINRQSETLQAVFGPQSTPPSYTPQRSASFATSSTSSRSSTQAYKTPPPRYFQVNDSPSLDKAVIPKDSLILVTAANSFQGVCIVDQLLEQGYRVRGTVRSVEKAAWTTEYFDSNYGAGKYTASVVPDMAVKGAFDVAARGCSGVIHVASVTSMSPDPNEVITPSIAGALNALDAAASEPNVVRFVLTSSVAAAISQDRSSPSEVSTHTWNMMDFTDAWAPPPYEDDRAFSVHSSSKMQTEAAVWRWHEVQKPAFALNTVLADTVWGRMLVPKHQKHPLSVAILKAAFEGKPVEYPPCNFVDVQDSALLHVAALILPDVENQRIFAVAAPWNVRSLVALMRGLFPTRRLDCTVSDLGVDQTFFKETGKSEELLWKMGKKGWTDMETSVKNNCEAFI